MAGRGCKGKGKVGDDCQRIRQEEENGMNSRKGRIAPLLTEDIDDSVVRSTIRIL